MKYTHGKEKSRHKRNTVGVGQQQWQYPEQKGHSTQWQNKDILPTVVPHPSLLFLQRRGSIPCISQEKRGPRRPCIPCSLYSWSQERGSNFFEGAFRTLSIFLLQVCLRAGRVSGSTLLLVQRPQTWQGGPKMCGITLAKVIEK